MKSFATLVIAASQAHAWGIIKAPAVETQSVIVVGKPSKYKGAIFSSDPSATPSVKQPFIDFLDGQEASSDLLSIDYHFNKGIAYGIRADKHSVVRVEEDKKEDNYISVPDEVEIRDLAVARNGTVYFVAFNTAETKSYIYKREEKENKLFKEIPGVLWSIALTEDESSFFAIRTERMPQVGKRCMTDTVKMSENATSYLFSKRIMKYVKTQFKVRASPEGNVVTFWGYSSLEVYNIHTRDANTIKADKTIKAFAIFNNEAYIAVPCISNGEVKVCFRKQSLANLSPARQQN
ncbi:hypothetical protein DSO57_1007022 [Entomophthora muscae]|uniref:Uncharacterized protein n=1 Tax=Entomophthora muscae TaxID=34485 RepID=A0ACC2RM57_9FUNG|nr:hypothetical protein DSO57_1007022 [Entomophthora muscae]